MLLLKIPPCLKRVATLSYKYQYSKADNDISQGSKAAHLRCGGIFNDNFLKFFLLPSVGDRIMKTDKCSYDKNLVPHLSGPHYTCVCIETLQKVFKTLIAKDKLTSVRG